jgi:hypothetical protein
MGKASPSLKSLRVPVRFFQSAFCLVFEEPVHGREHDSRPFGADMRVEIDFVVEKIDFSMPNHAEELPGHIEIVGMNDSIPYCESRAGFAGNAETGPKTGMANTSPLVTATFPVPRIRRGSRPTPSKS